MKKIHIKLILWDFNGVTVIGNHKQTAKYFGKIHHTPWQEAYDVLYTKYFNQLALNKITERTAWVKPIQELGWQQDWQQLRKWHLNYQHLNMSVVDYVLSLHRRGLQNILFTKNFEPWVVYQEKRLHFTRYFDDILNTQKYNIPKASKRTIRFVCQRYGVRPEEIIYIDDQQQNLTDAKALGVHTVLYHTFAQMRTAVSAIIRKNS